MNLKSITTALGVVSALKVHIPYLISECLKMSGIPSSRTMISHEVLKPSNGKVLVTIQQYLDGSGNKTRVIPTGPASHRESFDLTEHVESPSSTFLVCYRAAEQVKPGYELMFAVDSDPREQELNIATVKQTDSLLQAIGLMEEAATDLYRAQSFKLSRWNNYNATLLRSHQRLRFWRITQSLGVGGFVCAQIFFVRHIFNRKSHLLA